METRERMVCPDCGVGMNLHAEKIDQARSAEDGGEEGDFWRIAEFHTCPRCGLTQQRDGDERI